MGKIRDFIKSIGHKDELVEAMKDTEKWLNEIGNDPEAAEAARIRAENGFNNEMNKDLIQMQKDLDESQRILDEVNAEFVKAIRGTDKNAYRPQGERPKNRSQRGENTEDR